MCECVCVLEICEQCTDECVYLYIYADMLRFPDGARQCGGTGNKKLGCVWWVVWCWALVVCGYVCVYPLLYFYSLLMLYLLEICIKESLKSQSSFKKQCV